MAREFNYVIFRHGSNALNQSCQVAVLGSLKAKSRDEAKEKANDIWSCWRNQCFEAKPESKCSGKIMAIVFELDSWRESNGPVFSHPVE